MELRDLRNLNRPLPFLSELQDQSHSFHPHRRRLILLEADLYCGWNPIPGVGPPFYFWPTRNCMESAKFLHRGWVDTALIKNLVMPPFLRWWQSCRGGVQKSKGNQSFRSELRDHIPLRVCFGENLGQCWELGLD
jgi:hypothetical protein